MITDKKINYVVVVENLEIEHFPINSPNFLKFRFAMPVMSSYLSAPHDSFASRPAVCVSRDSRALSPCFVVSASNHLPALSPPLVVQSSWCFGTVSWNWIRLFEPDRSEIDKILISYQWKKDIDFPPSDFWVIFPFLPNSPNFFRNFRIFIFFLSLIKNW